MILFFNHWYLTLYNVHFISKFTPNYDLTDSMCMCVCVCIYIYSCMYVCVYVFIYIHIYLYICMYVCMYSLSMHFQEYNIKVMKVASFCILFPSTLLSVIIFSLVSLPSVYLSSHHLPNPLLYWYITPIILASSQNYLIIHSSHSLAMK